MLLRGQPLAWAHMAVSSVMGGKPAVAPGTVRDVRRELAEQWLRGSGIEIGALHLPMVMPGGVRVRYVDRMTVPQLRAHYPELRGLELAPVDVVDDGERLGAVAAQSVDFIVANHFLEHCEDPIRTIGTHLGKLRPGGVLFYAVPDKRYTFDSRRPRTSLGHLVDDYENGAERSRRHHYLEWARLVPAGEPPDEAQAAEHAARLQAESYSIHFHVWTHADLVELMLHCREQLGSFDIEAVRRRGAETIVVLRKRGEPAGDPGPAPTAVASGRMPLSALRSRLDAESATSHWSIDPDGLHGRALVALSGGTVTFPLRLDGAVTFSAQVRLLPHDWRDGSGAVRAWVAVTSPEGRRRQLWSGSLPSAARRGHPDGLTVGCELPAETTALLLGVQQTHRRDSRSVARAAWIQPELTDPAALVSPSPLPPGAPQPPIPSPSADGPLISVLTPVHDPPLQMLEEAIASVRIQTFTGWQLCLVDDGSTNPEVIEALQDHAASDSRIRLTRREQPGGISTATNAALEHASGRYIALLDHDDTLHPHALQHIVDQLSADPHLDMIYTDEAVVADGQRVAAHLKPDWSPENICALMYTNHLGVYRRELAREIGGFRSDFDGCQDYDFVLRLTERTERIAHLPHVLYHWRAHPSSTAGGEAKPYAYLVQPRAIAAHLERTGIDAEVKFGAAPGLHRIVHRVDPSLTVTLVLAVENADGLTEAARSWITQPHPTWRIALAASPSTLPAATEALRAAGVPPSRITTLTTVPGTDLATALAAAAQAADTEHLLLMQAPVLGLTRDWLTRLLGYSSQPGIAAAGPIVLAPDGRIHHAGVALPDGIPLHLLHGSEARAASTVAMNVSALSGVLTARRHTFQQLGGLQPEWGELALVDLCLRATERNLRIVTVPDARLRITGADHTTNDLPRVWQIRRYWQAHHAHDPHYNPNLRTDRGDFTP